MGEAPENRDKRTPQFPVGEQRQILETTDQEASGLESPEPEIHELPFPAARHTCDALCVGNTFSIIYKQAPKRSDTQAALITAEESLLW